MQFILTFQDVLLINYYLGGGSLPLASSLPTAGITLPPLQGGLQWGYPARAGRFAATQPGGDFPQQMK